MDQETTNLLRLQRRTLLLPSLLLPQAILVLQLHFRRLLEPLPPPATKMDHATSLSWHLLPWTIAFASEILIRGSSLSLSLSLCARVRPSGSDAVSCVAGKQHPHPGSHLSAMCLLLRILFRIYKKIDTFKGALSSLTAAAVPT